MTSQSRNLQELVYQARALGPMRVAVADAAQGVVIETLREAHALGFVEPRLVGDPESISALCQDQGWTIADHWIVPADNDATAAARAVELVHSGEADAVMKGSIHTDTFMHALLDRNHGLRVPGRRVSHVFIVQVRNHSSLAGSFHPSHRPAKANGRSSFIPIANDADGPFARQIEVDS